ncbi:MAG TPA: EAL domain-containing protein, partial [Burkholderiaceae bacterium]|nr:EAL domain-containing protein [Burkholderiaceae bacterium]
LFVAVNVSGRQIKRGALVSQVSDALARAGADLRCLEIEITEHTLVEDVTANIATLTGLREQGMRIAVDDFGTGLSSLAYLKRLPIDKFKIDRSFVRELPYAAGDVAIVTAIISMARALGLQVVAEGVETDAQRELLARLGCDFAQGYLFGSPMPAHELDPLLRSRNVDWSRAGLASTSEVASNGDAGDVSGSDVCVVGGDTREVCPDAVSASGEEPSHPRCR